MQDRASLTESAYNRIKSEIMENRIPSGFQCTETELAERFDISRTPIHEALVRLAQERLIEVKPRHGMRVLPISVDDLRDIYGLLFVLEPECASALARQGLSGNQIAQLRAAADAMRDAIVTGNLDAWAAADNQFHRLQLAYLRNRRLADIIGLLLDQAHRVRMFTLRFRALPVRSTEEHAEMVSLLEEGDADGLASLFRRHRETAARELFDILERYDLKYL
ncbi:MAG: GntR family transcriptional regulator [Thalassobaculum sp.]|uniref:GntR family transcriptional regulator n=1 Tax=Thalassobaculum sp. TaxID=2022740 RepID=UPI0032ED829E